MRSIIFMRCSARLLLPPVLAWLVFLLPTLPAHSVIRDGGIDTANLNLGQGGWLYMMNQATNHLYPNKILAVTNENSLFQYMTNQGLRYVIVKSGTGGTNYWDGTYSQTTPVFTSNLVSIAHANGLRIFGSNRSYGQDIAGEIAVAGYVFSNKADGLIFDAESEWESGNSWITNGPAQAWWLCGTVRSNWPTKFIAHNPYDTLYSHSSFPFKQFGYWTDCVMPQVYHHSASQGNAFAAIHWTDVNYDLWQKSLVGLSSVMNGQTIYWTNAIKPLVLMRDVYGVNWSSPYPPQDVMNFLDYLVADPNCVTAGGYQGSDYFRTELYDTNQWAYMKAATIGSFPGVVNNIIIDDANASIVGAWTMVKTIDATTSTVNFYGATGTDTNSFGTNYFSKGQGTGAAYMQFTPNIITPGDYNLYQWHPTRASASATVPFVINYGGGSTTIYANQRTNGGNWSLLGRFNFGPGTIGNIRVTDAIAESGGITMVDGLKLVFVPPTSPPSPPTRLNATTVSSSQIALAWTDTSTNAGCFAVARATTSGGPYQDIATVAIRPPSYLDSNLAPNTTYYYVVRATNFLGSSANSGQAVATTLPASPVFAWGDNSCGQSTVPLSATNVIAIAVGSWHTLALRLDGTVGAWGDNYNGQCDVPVTLTNALAIAAGGYHSLAIRADGTVGAWGDNDANQIKVPAGLARVMAISAGTLHSLALRTDGSVVAWGDNSWGQTNVPAGLGKVVAIAAGGNHNLAIKADGTVVGWGENADAGGDFVGQSLVPLSLTNVIGLAAGEYHSLALRADGTVMAWGDNSEGECSVPVGLSNVVALAGGGAHSLALKADGSVVAWGANWDGQCNLPSNLSDVVGLGAGEYHSVVLVAGSVPVPRLWSPAWQNQRFSVLLQALNRKSYTLEYKSSLTANWIALSTNTGNGALKQLCDPPAATTPASAASLPKAVSPTANQGFYRVRLW